MATRRTWGRRERSTSARRYQERTRPSPQGVNRTDRRSPVRAVAQAVKRSSAARSARAGVAWTFGLDASGYAPLRET
ncbi:hypothetical protein GCM10017687_63340 [Streptomyces echinatus]|uniref:Uncharacterized protein n=1 Tax=Streptomyces echinatus TaxID=67293 RepID=A0A7W9PTE3_9ACTN|nr:hypothetical protein [Streptomyces echinatus]